MKILTKQQIVEASDVEYRDVPVPEWTPEGAEKGSCAVRLVSLNGIARERFDQEYISRKKGKNEIDLRGLKAFLLAMCIVDESGNRVFDEADLEVLNRKNGAVLDRLFGIASDMNGLSERSVKEMEGNLPGAVRGSSGADSPDNSGAQSQPRSDQ